MKRFGQGPDLMMDAFRENHLYSRRAGLLAKTHLWIQRAMGMSGHQGKKMGFHFPVINSPMVLASGIASDGKEGWVSLVMCKEIHRWLFLEGDSWMEFAELWRRLGFQQHWWDDPWGTPRSVCSFVLAPSWRTLCWCRTRRVGADQRVQGILRKHIPAYKAVN